MARASNGRVRPTSLYVSLYVPDFPVAVLQREERRPSPTAVARGQPPNRFVYAADAGARRCGVRVGMALAAALARYATAGDPQPLRIFDRDKKEEQRVQGLLLELAEKATPRFEEAAPGLLVLDFKGLRDPYAAAGELASGAAELGLRANVSVSMNRLVALSAARTQPGVTHVYPGQEEGFLQALPLDTLPLDDGELKTLKRWGLRTVGELAQLPPEQLSERFGERGACMARLARGKESSMLQVYQPPARLEVGRDFDWGIEALEPLILGMSSMLEQLCVRLHGLDQAAASLTTRLRLADGGEFERTIDLPSPLSDPHVLLTLVRIDLAAHPPRAAVEGAYVSAKPVERRQVRQTLFEPESTSPECMAVTLARLSGLVGGERVGTPSVPDTYRPGVAELQMFRPTPGKTKIGHRAKPGRARTASKQVAARSAETETARPTTPPRTSLVFRCYRPSHPARVVLREDRPVQFEAQGVRGPVTACAGPWRVSGEWWTPDGWQYQEWDVEVAGGLYRACCECMTGEWFLVGEYD
ncbi:MAG: hypothetical protein OXB91_00370 [Bryobacterales bacterium]|nr:hypothetical protein [Bryobacterales bacterium]